LKISQVDVELIETKTRIFPSIQFKSGVFSSAKFASHHNAQFYFLSSTI